MRQKITEYVHSTNPRIFLIVIAFLLLIFFVLLGFAVQRYLDVRDSRIQQKQARPTAIVQEEPLPSKTEPTNIIPPSEPAVKVTPDKNDNLPGIITNQNKEQTTKKRIIRRRIIRRFITLNPIRFLACSSTSTSASASSTNATTSSSSSATSSIDCSN